MRFGGLAFAAVTLGGCTIVHVDGAAHVRQIHIGGLRIEPAPDARLVAYRATGFGVVAGHDGPTLGFRDETVAIVRAPDDCRIVLFQPSEAAVRALAELGAAPDDLQNACTTGRSK